MQDQAAAEASHKDMANAIRALAMDAVQKAESGHPGMPMGMADVATVLFTRFLKYDASHPEWPDRDRFVLSAGHGSMLIYALLYLTGYPEMDIEEIKNFRQLGARTAGHPEYGHAPGIETTTGPLGQGIGNAVGMALAERLLSQRYGSDIVNHHTYCLAGDGCLMEGISQEAISLAGHYKLGRLIVLFDDNQISIDGPTSLTISDDQLERFRASNWHTAAVDGHDPEAIALAIENAKAVTDRPSIIACRTVIGYGAPKKAGTASTHGSPLGAEEIAGAREKLGWSYPPFVVPEGILKSWRAAGARHRSDFETWIEAAGRLDASSRARLTDPVDEEVRQGIQRAIAAIKIDFAAEGAKLATRQSSQKVLEKLLPVVPGLIGGSADLTGSVGTLTKQHGIIKPDDFAGNYIHYGVREHGMAAAMNGLALHGGIVPYGGTFLVFSDYCRPSIRLSALMGQRVVYVMTHDSIGLGEDGPTHQPVEQLAALRAIPGLYVMRPADSVECAECWEIALLASDTPTILTLTRQGLPVLRNAPTDENLSAKGAYVLLEPEGGRDVTLLATGSEVTMALDAAKMLQGEGIKAAVVSMPCWELFEAQDESYRDASSARHPGSGSEAAVEFGWQKWLGPKGAFIGMRGFGASAPAQELYKHFGITPEAAAAAARDLIVRK
ncbi:transketolase [Methyloceanibacter superfactus]|uniref:Transketolase n=2 Tax=Methyloceanibacter superfactus TaxID=1774969 RepID=A0A1E3W6R9_9HYPH|nr:transketolase [Methyloceanibacter superfactus]ODS01503.1 transketolase [Methyloceanibacter superfactus]